MSDSIIQPTSRKIPADAPARKGKIAQFATSPGQMGFSFSTHILVEAEDVAQQTGVNCQ